MANNEDGVTKDALALESMTIAVKLKNRDEKISRLIVAGDDLAEQAELLERHICSNEHSHDYPEPPGWQSIAWKVARDG